MASESSAASSEKLKKRRLNIVSHLESTLSAYVTEVIRKPKKA